MRNDNFDVAVIGAGPAGMAAAITVARHGAKVVVLDEQPSPGGQIYRGVTSVRGARVSVLGPDYVAGRPLAQRFLKSDAEHIPGALVWQVSQSGDVHYLQGGVASRLSAKRIILCSGAMERPFPIPGWTLPGVMTAGAAQILLKTSSVVPTDPVVLAGCGPLLYLLGWQYVRAGVPIRALVDTTTKWDYMRAAPHVGGALMGWRYLKKGLALKRVLSRAKIPVHTGARDLEVEGENSVSALSFKAQGRSHRIATSTLLLHQGVVPNTQFTWSLRVNHHWDEAQLCWQPDASEWGELSNPNISAAGDGLGIGGALAAELQGEISALGVLCSIGKISSPDRDKLGAALHNRLRGELRIRPFLDALYRPKNSNRIPASDDVIVCRCEEVTAGDIRHFVELGCHGPNQAKAFGRCGMGPCQGRQCGLTVTELISTARDVPPAEVGYFRIRPPIKPVSLGELANLAQ